MSEDSKVNLVKRVKGALKRDLEQSSLSDPKVIMLWIAFAALLGFVVLPLFGFCVTFLSMAAYKAGVHSLFSGPLLFIFGIIFGIATLYSIRCGSRLVLGTGKKTVLQVEKRLKDGTSTDLMEDLNILVTENLKLKRYQVAEFYSKQLILMAENPISAQTIKATSCWVSTPQYHMSFRYYFWWLYENKGTVSLTSSHFQLESQKYSFAVPIDKVIDISIAKHPWWIKPFPLRYISITFVQNGFEHTFFVSPGYLATDTVFDVNKYVAEWNQYLLEAKQNHSGLMEAVKDKRLLEQLKEMEAT